MMFRFVSDRRFVIHSYSADHGLLLLRSDKTGARATRVDILFQDVRAIELRSWFEGITIEEAEVDYLKGFSSHPSEMMEVGNRVYAVRGSGWSGFIVAGIVNTSEDDGNRDSPSKLL
jgi:hypothetical protein